MDFLMHYYQQFFKCYVCLLVVKPCDENVLFVTDKKISWEMKLTSSWVSGFAKN